MAVWPYFLKTLRIAEASSRWDVRTPSAPWRLLVVIWVLSGVGGKCIFFAEGHRAEHDVEVGFGSHVGVLGVLS